MKKNMKKVKKIMKKNKRYIILLILSLIIFIIGYIKLGIIPTVASLIFFDIIYILIFKKKKKNGAKTKPKKIIKTILMIFLISCILLMIFSCAFIYKIVKNAPEFNPDSLYDSEPSVIYAPDGTVIAKLGLEMRVNVEFEQIPEVLVNAIVATEDSRFFQHNGFDLPRFTIAAVQQALTGTGGGASTLTMQMSKKTQTSEKQTITRKFTDIYISIFEIEKNYTKEDIFEFYANSQYLGSGSYGVAQASKTYFNKDVSDINVSEAALLAGLFQLPSSYDPNVYPENAESRRLTVLYLMHRHGYISDEEYEIAKLLTVDKLLLPDEGEKSSSEKYQPFIDTVVAEVIKDTGDDPYVVPMEIYTTIDMSKQEYLSDIMNGDTFEWSDEYVDAGISVLDVETGAIVAVGAGRNRVGERQYNTATMLNKQIGSTSKPLYDYAPAFEYLNWSTYHLFADEAHSYSNGIQIYNWDRKYQGLITLRDAIIKSRNIPALKTFQSVDNEDILNFVTSIGLDPEINDGIVHEAHSIGGYTGESPLSVSAAYASFSNGGYYIEPYSYTKIIYKEDNQIVEKVSVKEKVMSKSTAYMICDILSDAKKFSVGNYYYAGGAEYGAKSGTSNYSTEVFENFDLPYNAVNDLWIAGISPDYSITIWYGYKEIIDDYSNTISTKDQQKIFQKVATEFFETGSHWTMPDSVVSVTVENNSYPASLPSEFTPDSEMISELFQVGTEPTEVSQKYAKLDNVSNLTADVENNILTLAWDAVLPYALDTEVISDYIDGIYSTNNADRKVSLLNDNIALFGSVIYEVYSSVDGELTLITQTSDTTTTLPLSFASPLKYVVKTKYTNFSSNISEGATTEISDDDITINKIEIQLETLLNVPLNDPTFTIDSYNESSVSVYVNDHLATDAIVTYEIKKDDVVVDTIDITTAGTYKVYYNTNYKGKEKTALRTVVIK